MHPDLEKTAAADEKLLSRVKRTLRACECDLPVTVVASAENGLITLSGEISNPSVKRRYLTCVGRVPGVHKIVDQLKVRSRGMANA